MVMLNNNLRIFISAAESGSLTDTAKKMYVSQPAVSQAIRKLEDELNVKLFIRNKRGKLALTDIGEEILSCARKMADMENRLYQAAYRENHMTGGVVRVATVPIGMSMILSRILPVFRERFPLVKVELSEGNPYAVKNMVLNYQASLGITTSPYLGLEHRNLLRDRIVSVNRDKIVAVDLRQSHDNLIFCRVARDSVLEQLSGQDINLMNCLVVEAASTQINMVENGNGTGVISELMLSTIKNSLARGDVFPKMEMDIALVAHSFHDLPTASGKMADMILESLAFD